MSAKIQSLFAGSPFWKKLSHSFQTLTSKVAAVKQTVWHYAPWQYLPAMLRAGFLRPSNAQANGEESLLWFSSNQHWEPTATKLVPNRHGLVRLTFEQQARQFGCVRFGLPADDPRLLDWRDACRAARTPRECRRRMEKAGERLGAKPDDWFATVADVPLADLLFQVWLYQLRWQPANPAEMATLWEQQAGAAAPP